MAAGCSRLTPALAVDSSENKHVYFVSFLGRTKQIKCWQREKSVNEGKDLGDWNSIVFGSPKTLKWALWSLS